MGSKSPQNFTYGSKASDAQFFGLEEPPRSPKITYSTPSPTSHQAKSVADMTGNTSPSSGYFEQRSPKYLSHQSSPRKFVFDAVSPRRESISKLCVIDLGIDCLLKELYSRVEYDLIASHGRKSCSSINWLLVRILKPPPFNPDITFP